MLEYYLWTQFLKAMGWSSVVNKFAILIVDTWIFSFWCSKWLCWSWYQIALSITSLAYPIFCSNKHILFRYSYMKGAISGIFILCKGKTLPSKWLSSRINVLKHDFEFRLTSNFVNSQTLVVVSKWKILPSRVERWFLGNKYIISFLFFC